jgi:hypothetical protein
VWALLPRVWTNYQWFVSSRMITTLLRNAKEWSGILDLRGWTWIKTRAVYFSCSMLLYTWGHQQQQMRWQIEWISAHGLIPSGYCLNTLWEAQRDGRTWWTEGGRASW